MTTGRIELVYFEGCPHAQLARENIRKATEGSDVVVGWQEWDLDDEGTPERYRRHASPTVLVDGVDVTGAGRGPVAMACRADGAPSVEAIAAALLVARRRT